MRIMHAISAMAAGGAETLVKDLAINLVRQGHQLAVAFVSSAKDQGADSAFEQDFNSQLAANAIPTFEIGHSARRNPILGGWRFRTIVKKFNPDVLHIHLATVLVFRMSALVNVPTIYTHHNTRFRFPPMLLRVFDNIVDHHVAISDTNLRLLEPLTRKPITKIYNGVSEKRFRTAPQRGSRDRLNVLSVGRIQPQKDYSTLIEVASLAATQLQGAGRQIKFRIAGDGAGVDELRQTVHERRLEGIVEFLGARTDIPSLMAQSDVMLMTSVYEGLPISLIEALHSGLPIVATDVGACREIVHPGINGALARAGDPKDIANKLIELLIDDAVRTQFSNGAAAVAAQFSIDSCARQHAGLYRQVAQVSPELVGAA